MKKYIKLCLVFNILWLTISCGPDRKKYVKTPIDNIITEYMNVPNYSVILADMNYRETTDEYFHKYKIIIIKKNNTESVEDDFDVKLTDWKKVSDITFDDYQNDLGMTILSKKDGVLNKKSKPAGYDNYVGNPKYGRWQTNSSGSSFWAFYGQYAFMRSLLGWGSGMHYYRNDYDYYRRNYYGSSNYYGRSTNYGTSSKYNKNTSWNQKPKSFKDQVRGNVSRSATAKKGSGYSSSRSYGSPFKTDRNSSRYNSYGSSRSRSGGYGK